MILSTVVGKNLVPTLATRETVGPLSNDPIMSGRLTQSFRNLEHQIMSII